ncbi:hypothetical protein M434DRAFT_14146 [Hypoxylon sp. CO27-5]|nr:hypothetical protein M434DRAFT_14146 [Hypoxylon sp. CO27-5]
MESAGSEIHKKNAALRGFESLLAGIVALFLYYNIPVIYQACITTIYEKLGLDTWVHFRRDSYVLTTLYYLNVIILFIPRVIFNGFVTTGSWVYFYCSPYAKK